MRSRILVGALMILGLGVGAIATSSVSTRQWAIINLQEPTRILNTAIMGPILVVHDDTKMAKGEPCTSIYRFDPKTGPGEEIVAFHCKPRRAAVVDTFTFTRVPDKASTLRGGVLTGYQFAGDNEFHGVPDGR